MSKKYQISLLVISVLLVLAIITGTSYALWSNTHVQQSQNVVTTTCFSITFAESSNISMSNAYPMSDEKGLTTTPYTFTVTNT